MLPETQWKWPTHRDGTLADWELNFWFNYEYARSHRPMVKWVRDLHATKPTHRPAGELPPTRCNPPRFALFLSKHFPEFPDQPWLTIPQPDRWARLEQAGITEATSFLESSTVQEIGLDIYSYRTAIGDCDYDPGNLEDETHLLVKINFHRSDKQIENRLRQILDRRRRHLKELYAKTVKHHIQKQFRGPPPADPTEPDGVREGVGQRKNRRVYYNRMQDLSALRLFVHFDRDLEQLQLSSTLYVEEFSWQRAKNAALDMMVRLREAWNSSFSPPFVMEPTPPAHVAVPRTSRLRRKLPRPEGKPMDSVECQVEAEILRVPGRLQ